MSHLGRQRSASAAATRSRSLSDGESGAPWPRRRRAPATPTKAAPIATGGTIHTSIDTPRLGGVNRIRAPNRATRNSLISGSVRPAVTWRSISNRIARDAGASEAATDWPSHVGHLRSSASSCTRSALVAGPASLRALTTRAATATSPTSSQASRSLRLTPHPPAQAWPAARRGQPRTRAGAGDVGDDQETPRGSCRRPWCHPRSTATRPRAGRSRAV